MNDDTDEGEKEAWSLGFTIFAVVVFIVAVMVINVLFMNHLYDEPGDRGTAGDQFGSVTALFSGLAFAGLIITLLIQRKELELQRKELKASNKEFALQRFDSAFFGVVRMLNEHVATIRHDGRTGREALAEISEAVKESYDTRKRAVALALDETKGTEYYDPDQVLAKIFVRHDAQLGPYFRILHNVYRLIDAEDKLSEQQKFDYARIARAHISLAELDLIFLNGITHYAVKFLPFIQKYGILKHTSPNTRNKFREINDRYKQSAFAGIILAPEADASFKQEE